MAIQFTCSCGRKFQAADEHAGRRVKCPACGAGATVPADGTPVLPAEEVPSRAGPNQAEEPPRIGDERDEDRSRRPRRVDDEADDQPRLTQQTSGKAVAALVLGYLSFCFNVLAAVPAVILALQRLSEISRSRGRLAGKRIAIAGLVLAFVGTLFSGAVAYSGYVAGHAGIVFPAQMMAPKSLNWVPIFDPWGPWAGASPVPSCLSPECAREGGVVPARGAATSGAGRRGGAGRPCSPPTTGGRL
jgi:hypothetical protein